MVALVPSSVLQSRPTARRGHAVHKRVPSGRIPCRAGQARGAPRARAALVLQEDRWTPSRADCRRRTSTRTMRRDDLLARATPAARDVPVEGSVWPVTAPEMMPRASIFGTNRLACTASFIDRLEQVPFPGTIAAFRVRSAAAVIVSVHSSSTPAIDAAAPECLPTGLADHHRQLEWLLRRFTMLLQAALPPAHVAPANAGSAPRGQERSSRTRSWSTRRCVDRCR